MIVATLQSAGQTRFDSSGPRPHFATDAAAVVAIPTSSAVIYPARCAGSMMGEPASPDTRAVSLAEGRLVGRGAEMARILSAFDTAASGDGRTVLLFGEPGIGKTSLGYEVLARARERGAQVRVGRAFEEHTAVPYFPFTEALTFTMKEGRRLPPDEVLNRWPELVRLLVEAGMNQPKTGGTASQLPVFRAVTAFFHALADVSPLVLLLDDLQWADTTSLSLLLYLCRHLAGARMLVLCTYRALEPESEQIPAEIVRELVRDGLAEEVRVGRLAVHETAALIRARLQGASVSSELVALIHDRAQGNPFFTEELLKALVERGYVSQVRGRWETRVSDKIDVPRSVRWVLGQRVKRLASDAQELLRLASVVGGEFELDVLLGACGQPEADVFDHLDAALRAGLLEELRDGNVERYRFAHVLIQQTLYDELPSHRRRRLHRRVGEALEAAGAGRSVLPARLARHFLAAGDDERAVRYAIEAGHQAAMRYAHAEAARHYQVALDRLLERGDEVHAADVQCRLAQELFDLNQLAEALASYQAALATFERLGDSIGQARVHRGIGLVDIGRYDMVAAVGHFEAALKLWPIDHDDAELAGLLLNTAAIRANLFGSLAPASPLAERAVALAERSGDAGLLALCLMVRAITCMPYDPRPRATTARLDEAERVARGAGDWRVLCRVLLTRADYRELAGDLNATDAVAFSGTSASFTVVSDTYMTATVPSGATTGPVTVRTSGRTLTSNKAFHVIPRNTNDVAPGAPAPQAEPTAVPSSPATAETVNPPTVPDAGAPTGATSPAVGDTPPQTEIVQPTPELTPGGLTGEAGEGDGPTAPDTLTENLQAEILSAVDRANSVWVQALESLDPLVLNAGVASTLLNVDLAEVDKLRGDGQTRNNVNTAFVVTDVTLDAPGHATVQTHETWTAEIRDAGSGRPLQRINAVTYDETYVVEYLNHSWIVTRNDLH